MAFRNHTPFTPLETFFTLLHLPNLSNSLRVGSRQPYHKLWDLVWHMDRCCFHYSLFSIGNSSHILCWLPIHNCCLHRYFLNCRRQIPILITFAYHHWYMLFRIAQIDATCRNIYSGTSLKLDFHCIAHSLFQLDTLS